MADDRLQTREQMLAGLESPTVASTRGATLLALAERCEAATGPDRELDAEIDEAVGHPVEEPAEPKSRANWPQRTSGMATPAYTASLDAALTLVPEGLSLGFTIPFRRFAMVAAFVPRHEKARAQLWEPLEAQRRLGEAATPALALCAAALRALAAQAEGGAT